jgi:hypothetical protein
MTVPLPPLAPWRSAGDSRNPHLNRNTRNNETQSRLKTIENPILDTHTNRNFPTPPTTGNRSKEIGRTAEGLIQSLERLRSRIIKAIEELRFPQDCPGPPNRLKVRSNGDFTNQFEEKEEVGGPFRLEKEMEVIRGLTPQFITGEFQKVSPSIKSVYIRGDATPILHPTQDQWSVCSNLLLKCSMTTNKVNPLVGVGSGEARISINSASQFASPIKGGSQNQLGFPRRQKDKEIAGDLLAENERALVINMTGARQAVRPRFLAVGLFLSTLLVSSDLLIERMKKVWRIRGIAEANQIEAEEGRKFIIEFTEEGDRQHAVRGGPW